jgi:hypothetical protein
MLYLYLLLIATWIVSFMSEGLRDDRGHYAPRVARRGLYQDQIL